MLKRENRLSGQRSVARVYRSGKTVRSGGLSLRFASNNQEGTRIAVVVSKKVAKSAPVRNRIRRRLFETVRGKWPEIKPGFDAIISVYEESIKSLPQEELDALVNQLLSKSKLAE